jgi:LuxR family maltose regulon positive regulatory protein
MLEAIERSNSFLVPLDTRREWYRYHHLFGDLLRRELEESEADLVPELHRKAAAWLLDAGFWSEAILHSLAAGDASQASELIARHWLEFRDLHRLETILSWFAELPRDVIESDPRLCLIQAATVLELGREDEGSELLDLAQKAESKLADQAERQRVRSGVLANRVILHYLRGDVGGIRALAGTHLDRDDDGDPYWHSVLYTTLGAALFLSGRSEVAIETLARGVETSRRAGHALAQTHALGWTAVALAELGDLSGVRAALDEIDAAVRHRPALSEYYGTSLAHIARGGLLERQSAAIEAEEAMRRGVELALRSGSGLQTAYALSEYTRLKQGLGAGDEAAELLRRAREAVETCPDPGILRERVAKLSERLSRDADGGIAALSGRELQVGRLVVARKTNQEIAAELFISKKTVETHVRHIFEKLGVTSRVEIARAIESADAAEPRASSKPA